MRTFVSLEIGSEQSGSGSEPKWDYYTTFCAKTHYFGAGTQSTIFRSQRHNNVQCNGPSYASIRSKKGGRLLVPFIALLSVGDMDWCLNILSCCKLLSSWFNLDQKLKFKLHGSRSTLGRYQSESAHPDRD